MRIGFDREKISMLFEEKMTVLKSAMDFKCKALKRRLQLNKNLMDERRAESSGAAIKHLRLAYMRFITKNWRKLERGPVSDIKKAYSSIADSIADVGPAKLGKAGLSFVLSLSLIVGSSISGFALDSALEPSKEEVVYVNLNADGSVDQIYVVNIFDLNEEGEIIDYGAYEEVRMMNSNDDIKLENEKVSIYTDEHKLYYEGVIKGNALPWVFDIHYFLNGKEYKAEQLGGKSGELKIELGIRQNTENTLGFFENYCLQINLTLDTNNAENIVAEGATIGNVGSKKQITFIALPGDEHDYVITADVNKFTMSGFEINGLKMNVGLTDIDTSVFSSDLEALEDGVTRLAIGASQLADGAGELSGGAADLLSGVRELRSGVATLKNGAGTLQSGTRTLRDGTAELASGAKALANAQYTAQDGAYQISKGSKDLEIGAKSVSDGAYELYDGLSQLSTAGLSLSAAAAMLGEKSLEQNRDFLARAGYFITDDMDYEELAALCTKRQEELMDSDEMLRIQLAAVKARMEIATDEDVLKLLYCMAFGLEYKLAGCSAEEFQAVADYSDFLLSIGGINMVEDKLDEWLMTEKGQTEYAEIEKLVIDQFTGFLMKDDIYSILMTLAIGRGLGFFTEKLGEARSGAAELAGGAVQLYDGTSTLSTAAQTLYNGLIQISSGVDSIGYAANTLYSGADQIYSGAASLNNGLGDALAGVDTLQGGAKQLYDGSIIMKDNCIQMKNGSEELRLAVCSSTQGMAGKIIQAIDDIFGADFIAPSFVDTRNENVEFVQFVIKTTGILPPQAEEESVTSEETNLWTRIIKLFGVEKSEGTVND